MTQFDDREKAFEKKFELDEEARFKIDIRAAKLFGLWTGKQMGLKESEAESYAVQLAEVAVLKPDRDHVIRKAETHLAAKGVQLSRHRLEKEMNACESAAARSG